MAWGGTENDCNVSCIRQRSDHKDYLHIFKLTLVEFTHWNDCNVSCIRQRSDHEDYPHIII